MISLIVFILDRKQLPPSRVYAFLDSLLFKLFKLV